MITGLSIVEDLDAISSSSSKKMYGNVGYLSLTFLRIYPLPNGDMASLNLLKYISTDQIVAEVSASDGVVGYALEQSTINEIWDNVLYWLISNQQPIPNKIYTFIPEHDWINPHIEYVIPS